MHSKGTFVGRDNYGSKSFLLFFSTYFIFLAYFNIELRLFLGSKLATYLRTEREWSQNALNLLTSQ